MNFSRKQEVKWTINSIRNITQASAITFMSTPGQRFTMAWALCNFILGYQ